MVRKHSQSVTELLEAEHDDPKPEPVRNQRLTDHLANQRTFLVWSRSCVGLITLGCVFLKLSLFALLYHPDFLAYHSPFLAKAHTLGGVLILFGGFFLILSYVEYRVTMVRIQRNTYHASHWFVSLYTLCLCLIALYLLFIAS